jgi:hypothetical protein
MAHHMVLVPCTSLTGSGAAPSLMPNVGERGSRGSRAADAQRRGDRRARPWPAWPARTLRGHPSDQPYVGLCGRPPDRITIYRPAICAVCQTGQEVADQARRTVIHEIARHFGIDDDRLTELGW